MIIRGCDNCDKICGEKRITIKGSVYYWPEESVGRILGGGLDFCSMLCLHEWFQSRINEVTTKGDK